MSGSVIRIVVGDDHALVLEGLRTLLDDEEDLDVVAVTRDGSEVASLVEQHRPDVVLLDLEFGDVRGTEVIGRLKALPDPPRVLALTAYNDGETLRSVLDSGADGLSYKTEPPERTIAAIREVHAGRLVFPQAAKRWLGRREVGADHLTPRELEVWALIAEGLTNRQIGERLDVGENTVKYHVQNLFMKLGVHNRTEAALKFAERGRSPEI